MPATYCIRGRIMKRTPLAFLSISLLLIVRLSVLPTAEPLQPGFGEVDVTPKHGAKPVFMAGFGHNRKATDVADPIMARAVVLKHDKQKIAFVSIDVVGFFHLSVERIRKQLT